MFLIERIIGIATYVLLLIFICSILNRNINKEKNILKMYVILLTILAFFYVPSESADLYRHFQQLDRYSTLSSDGFIEILKSSTLPTSQIIFYIVSKIGVYSLLPAFAAYVFYNNVIYIYIKSSQIYNLDKKSKMILLTFIMSLGTFVEVISGIRTMLAFGLITRCIFEEIFENKKIYKNLIWYFLASTIHLVGFAVVLLRIIVYIVYNNKKKIFSLLLCLSIIILIITFGNDILVMIIDKGEGYLTGEGYKYTWEYLIMIIANCYSLVANFKSDKKDSKLKEIRFISNILILIMLATINTYTIFHRIGTLNIILNIPLIANYISSEDKRKQNLFLVGGIIILLIAATRGNLCGYKFFEM